MKYLSDHYGRSIIVFDGYASGPSTKVEEHSRRGGKMLSNVKVSPDVVAHGPQSAFLANGYNKTQLIQLLKSFLTEAGHVIHQAPSDGDCIIVKVALERMTNDKTVVVVTDDTDVLIMLIHHHNLDDDLYFYSEASARSKNRLRYVSIRELKDSLDPIVVSNIFFLHAWSGYDTTFAIYSHSKNKCLMWNMDSNHASELVAVFIRWANS